VILHLFAPRVNESYESLDNLELWNVGRKFLRGTICRHLIVQLNLFAGTLYLSTYDEYIEVCGMLGLRCIGAPLLEGQQAGPDNFIQPPVGSWGLKASPVPFFKALLMNIRREGGEGSKSHMGMILGGKLMMEENFRRKRSTSSRAQVGPREDNDDAVMEDIETTVQNDDAVMEDAEPRAEEIGAGVDIEMGEAEDSLFVSG
jgi:hypothetical protein